uniref:Reverse transcriptase domain-containing protein n=1 Tax=Amphimedon queenslandica TaxID=400682 RepID=A0A1X7U7N7_AMPQE
MYVDDVVSGARTAKEVLKLFKDFKLIMKESGFNLPKFVSSQIDANNNPTSSGELSKVLGINWNLSTDEIVMDLKPIVDEVNIFNPTKRHIVSIVSKGDPVGLLSPVIVKLKMFLQELHCLKNGWDEQISESMRKNLD